MLRPSRGLDTGSGRGWTHVSAVHTITWSLFQHPTHLWRWLNAAAGAQTPAWEACCHCFSRGKGTCPNLQPLRSRRSWRRPVPPACSQFYAGSAHLGHTGCRWWAETPCHFGRAAGRASPAPACPHTHSAEVSTQGLEVQTVSWSVCALRDLKGLLNAGLTFGSNGDFCTLLFNTVPKRLNRDVTDVSAVCICACHRGVSVWSGDVGLVFVDDELQAFSVDPVRNVSHRAGQCELVSLEYVQWLHGQTGSWKQLWSKPNKVKSLSRVIVLVLSVMILQALAFNSDWLVGFFVHTLPVRFAHKLLRTATLCWKPMNEDVAGPLQDPTVLRQKQFNAWKRSHHSASDFYYIILIDRGG